MRTLFFALGVLALVGCKGTGLKPIGPLAKDTPATQPLPGAPAVASSALPPRASHGGTHAPAIRPTPPTMLVTPGEVTADNAHTLAQTLASELSTDGKASANAPVTVEVSRLGRVKP